MVDDDVKILGVFTLCLWCRKEINGIDYDAVCGECFTNYGDLNKREW